MSLPKPLDGIELVLFDLDGTLIDSVPSLAQAIDAMLAQLGRVAAGEAKVRQWVGNGAQVLVERALSDVKTLRGMLPICASCKKVRDDDGYWRQIEAYVRDHSEAEFTHGLCPGCMKEYYPDEVDSEGAVLKSD